MIKNSVQNTTMFSKKVAIYTIFFVSAPRIVLSFSLQVPKALLVTRVRSCEEEESKRGVTRSVTALAVVMGGAETPLGEIPQNLFGYDDTILENLNERTISLLGQFQDSPTMEQLLHSQDSLAQTASFLSANVDPIGQLATVENPVESVDWNGPPDVQWMAPTSPSYSFNSMEGPFSDSWENYQSFASMPEIDPMQSLENTYQLPRLDSILDGTVSQMIADSAGAMPASKTVAAQAAATASQAAPVAKTAAAQAVTTVSNAIPAAKTTISQAASSVGMDANKKLIAELEKTVSSFDSLASKSGDSLEDYARQLSDQLYQSFATPQGAQAALADAPKYIAKQGDAVIQGALDGAGRILESSTSRIVEKGAETLQAVQETPIKAILSNMIQIIEQIMKILLKTMDGLLQRFSGYNFSGHMAHFKSSLTQLVAHTTGSISASANKIGHLNMQQIVEFMLKEVIYFMQALSGIFLSLLDALLKSFTGDTLVGHIHHLQVSVNTVTTDTVRQLTSALHDLGQINVSDAAKLLVSLVTFMVKLLFQLFSAFVIVLSGQGIDDWTIQAAGAIKSELASMAASTAEVGTTIAESSINELGAILLQLLENTSIVLVEGMQALLESLGLLVQSGGSLAGVLATDTVQSLSSSASVMTANL